MPLAEFGLGAPTAQPPAFQLQNLCFWSFAAATAMVAEQVAKTLLLAGVLQTLVFS